MYRLHTWDMILIRLEHLPLVPLNHGNDTFIKIYIDPGPLNMNTLNTLIFFDLATGGQSQHCEVVTTLFPELNNKLISSACSRGHIEMFKLSPVVL